MPLNLKLGTAKVDITPAEPLQLAGFSARHGLNYEIIDQPIFARIHYFEQDHNVSNKRKSLVISADILSWGLELIKRLRTKIYKRWKITQNAIIFHATHNHSGPQTSNSLIEIGELEPRYIQLLEARLLKGIGSAIGNLEEVQVERGKGHCPIGINRRKYVNGKIDIAPNVDGPKDPEVNVIRFTTMEGKTKALFVHYTCHPATTNRNVLSAEFCGIAVDYLERYLGEGAFVSYLQGCCGDIDPLLQKSGTEGTEAINILGHILAEEVIRIVNTSLKPVTIDELRCSQKTIDLPFQRVPSIKELRQIEQSKTGIVKKWAQKLLDEPERLQQSIPLKLTRLDIADGLSFLAFNAEIVVEYGSFIKNNFANKILPIPYSNGTIGYVVTAKQLEEGGYEPEESIFCYGLPSRFDPIIEEKIRSGIIQFLNS
ncbi:hypothetical protein ACQCN2_05830 [Brevibacillus ginsengisoli]|uniref:hypothetical protein n=1 Tax=Brevibacillus ginsengisoli TaxID=363854 RepID=UPI003CF55A9E